MSCSYVVKARVPEALVGDWRSWMRDVHLPKVLAITGFETAHIAEIEGDASAMRTFVIHYTLIHREALDAYLRSPQCAALRAESAARHGDHVQYSREIWNPIE